MIVLAEHLSKLAENGLDLESYISGQQKITKKRIVECLHHIGQNDISKTLKSKQGKNIILFQIT